MYDAVYLVVGAFLAGIVGIATGCVNRWRARIIDREYMCRALEAEISQNQDWLIRVVPSLTESISKFVSKYYGPTEVILDFDELRKSLEFVRVGGIYFQKNVFMGLSGKLGLLNKETIKMVYQYYIVLSAVEMTLSCWMLSLCVKDRQVVIKQEELFVKNAAIAYQNGKNALKGIECALKG